MIISPNIQPKKLSSWVLLSALGILWGSSFLSVKYAIIAFDPLQIASFRLIIGFLVVFVFSLIFKIHVFNIFHSKIVFLSRNTLFDGCEVPSDWRLDGIQFFVLFE